MNEHERVILSQVVKKMQRVIEHGNLPRYLNQELAESVSAIRTLLGEDPTSRRLMELTNNVMTLFNDKDM